MGEVDFITSAQHARPVGDRGPYPRHLPGRRPAAGLDRLRARVGDAQGGLPTGTLPPQVNDSYGDIYGIYYASLRGVLGRGGARDREPPAPRDAERCKASPGPNCLGLPQEAVFVGDLY